MTIPATPRHPAPEAGSISNAAVETIGITTIGSLVARPDEDFLTLPEVAATLRTPVNTLRWWRQQGTGPRFFKIGRKLVTTVGDLKTWVADQKQGPGPGPGSDPDAA